MLEIRGAQKYSIVRMFVIMLILIAIFMVIVVIFASKLIRSIVKPLDETSLALNEIKNGNLNFNISYESMDEFGQMAEALRASQQMLESAFDEITRITNAMDEGDFSVEWEGELSGSFHTITDSLVKLPSPRRKTVENATAAVN